MPIRTIGIDRDGTNTKLAMGSEDGEIQYMETLPTAAFDDPQDYLDRLVERTGRLVNDNKITGIGLGAPGLLSKDRCSLRYNPNTPALVEIDFVTMLGCLNLPVWLEQDPNVPTLAKYYFGGVHTRKQGALISKY